MPCETCSHAQADHATGRCVHREMHHDPAVGAVIDACRCKRFAAPAKEPEPEPVVEAVVEEEKLVDEPIAEEPEPEPQPRRGFRPRR